MEQRAYYLCHGIKQSHSYKGQENKVKSIIEYLQALNPKDIVIYHCERISSSSLQQTMYSNNN